MAVHNWIELAFVAVLLVVSTPLLGNYMAKVYGNKKAPGDRFFLPIERFVYRVCGIDPEGEQRWSVYVRSMLIYTAAGVLLLYGVLRLQSHLPFNPDHMKTVPEGLSFNTAISFGTNTDWQNYAGETTLSHLSQMFGLVTKQFVSAGVGMALAAGFIRALVRRRQTTLGSFWVDTVRSITRILLPITFVFAIVFMSQGVIQNFHSTKTVQTVAAQGADAKGHPITTQQVPGGPVASMTPIEALGDNGGGFFNANGAHPLEASNPFTSVMYVWLLLAIPFAFPWTYGKMESREELERVYRLAELAAGGEPTGRLIQMVRDQLVGLLHLSDCEFQRPPFVDALPRLRHTGVSIPGSLEDQHLEGQANSGVELPVWGEGLEIGRFVLTFPTHTTGIALPPSARASAVALADQLGVILLAHER